MREPRSQSHECFACACRASQSDKVNFWIGEHVHGKVLFAIASDHAPNGILGMAKIFEGFQDRCFAPNFSDAGIQAGLSGCFQVHKLVNQQTWDKGATEAVKSVAALLPTLNGLAMPIPKIGGQCQCTRIHQVAVFQDLVVLIVFCRQPQSSGFDSHVDVF